MKLRFRLKTILLLTMVIAFPLAWYSNNVAHLNHERAVIANLQASSDGYAGLVVVHSGSEPIFCGTGINGFLHKEPARFIDKFGAKLAPELFERVTAVTITGYRFSDDMVLNLIELPFLEKLNCRKEMFSQTAWSKFAAARPEVTISDLTQSEFDDLKKPVADDVDPFLSDDPFGT